MKTKYISKNSRETGKLAKIFADEVLHDKFSNKPLVVALAGELGSGKTTFIRSFIHALGVKRKVTSPTFLILRRHPAPKKNFFDNVFHIDAYRINSTEELEGTDVTQALENRNNIVLVEWADNIRSIIPSNAIWIDFKYGKEKNERHITFNRR